MLILFQCLLHVFLTCLENMSQGVCVKCLVHQSFLAIHSFSCLLSWKHYFYLLFKKENIVSTVWTPCCGNDFKCLPILRSWGMSENDFASCFIPLASDTSFPLVMVPACGKCDKKQIAVPYRPCLGVGIVQIYVPLHLLVFGKQIAVYDQKIAAHKRVFQTSLFLPTQPQSSTWGARDNKGPEQEDTLMENSADETECSTGMLRMGRLNRWEGGRWKDDFWNGFPKDLTSLAAASERGRLWCSPWEPSWLPRHAGCLLCEQGGNLSLAAQEILY